MTKKDRKRENRNAFVKNALKNKESVFIGGKEYKANGKTLVRVSYQKEKKHAIQ